MDTSSKGTASHSPGRIWFKLGAALFVVALAVLFFVFASGRLRRKSYDEVPPGGSMPGKPGQVIAH